MILNFKFQIPNSQQGISLVITFLIMAIMLAIVLSISSMLFNQIKITSNIGDRMSAFYKAEGDQERALYIKKHSQHE